MAAELTNTQIMDVACEHLTDFAWDEDKVEAFARAILALATQQATQGAEPVGEIDGDGGQRWFRFVGKPIWPPIGTKLYTAPPPTAEVEKKAAHVIACARAVAEEAEDLGEDFNVKSHIMAPLSLALDEYDAALQSDQAQAGKTPTNPNRTT